MSEQKRSRRSRIGTDNLIPVGAIALSIATGPAWAGGNEELMELVRKQNAQIEQLQAEMRDLRMQVNQQMPASRSALTDSMASTSTDSPESGNSSRKAEAIARRKADTAPGAEVASVTPSGALDTIAPPALYSGMIPDLTLGRVVTRLRGDVVVEGGYVSQANDSHLNSSAARERFRFIVNPEVQANGGFSYGGLVRYVVAKGDQSVNAPDRTFLYARGPYGDFSAGVRNGYGDESYFPFALDYLPTGRFDTALGFMVPNGGTTGGAQGVDAINGRYQGADIGGGVMGALMGTSVVWPALAVDNNASKVMYMSPRFAGFRFGFDWTPRNDAYDISTNRLNYTTSTALTGAGYDAVFRNLIEVGFDYDQKFGDVRLLGDFVYMTGKSVPTATTVGGTFYDLRAYQAAFRVEYGGFAIGPSVLYLGKSAQQKHGTASSPIYNANTYNYSLEAQYRFGRWVVGGAYRYGQDPGQMTLPGARTLRVYELGAAYTLWKGMQLQMTYDHFVAHSDKATTATSGSPSDRGDVITARAVFRF
ncbi:porin [Burkholderia ambifaria]|uniref:porin n=1 Tax=Burkholderia ambifaria TaxID=152480 RepID=UPI001589E7FE|nr:porin [Burkholderia ambifaria]